MERLRKTFSFRKKKKKRDPIDSSKPQQWTEDEKKVREGNCSFQVKYLGHIEVFESRGLHVCEEAIKALRKTQKKPQRSILYVSGDALRVADEISKGLIVDQTIEKVSFCAPDRNHEKGFAYICRDGATRRWMCHGFLAVKESGERLSHAVGCAFAICLEKKQKREKDAVQVTYNEGKTSFERLGSFRQATLTERQQDPQSAILAEPPPPSTPKTDGSPASPGNSIPRPHASATMLERQGSLRLFPKLAPTSPFKRDLSLRLNELPSNLQRLNHILANGDSITEEMSPVREEEEEQGATGTSSNIGQVASEFSNQLSLLSASADQFGHSSPSKQPPQSVGLDPFSAAPVNPATMRHHQQLTGPTQLQRSPVTGPVSSVSNPFPYSTANNSTNPFPSGSNSPFQSAVGTVPHSSPFHSALVPSGHQQQHFVTSGQTHHAFTAPPVQAPPTANSPFVNHPNFNHPSTNPWSQPTNSYQGHQQQPTSWNAPHVRPAPPVMSGSNLFASSTAPGVSMGWSSAIQTTTASSSMSGFASDPFGVSWAVKPSNNGGVSSTVGTMGVTSTNPFLAEASSGKAFEMKM